MRLSGRRSMRSERTSGVALTVSALLLVALSLLAGMRVMRAVGAGQSGTYVITDNLRMRYGPGLEYPALKDDEGHVLLYPGDRVEVSEVSDGWGRIEYAGETVWIKLEYAVRVDKIEDDSAYQGETLPDPGDIEPVDWIVADISQWQRESAIDWYALKRAGLKGVILRIGGRYYGGVGRAIYSDDAFDGHYRGARDAGIPVGVYFFSSATSAELAHEEADFVIDKLSSGEYEIDFPVYIDTEDEYGPGLHYSAGKKVCTEVVKTFCDDIADAGYVPGVYSNLSFFNSLIDESLYPEYEIWVAQYSDSCDFNYPHGMWQYTNKGRLDGFDANLDLNHCYVDYPLYCAAVLGRAAAERPHTEHRFSDYVKTSDATLEKEGSEERTCLICGYTETRPTPRLQLGDVDKNGTLDVGDARIVLRVSVGLEPEDEELLALCDRDKDGVVTAADARRVLRVSVGLDEIEI